MGGALELTLEHLTDLAGIAALTVLALNGVESTTLVAAITSIALGQRYAKEKWRNQQTADK